MNVPSHASPLTRTLMLLETPGRIVVTAHARPDGDALGAALGLARALVRQGRDAVVALARNEIGSPGVLDGVEDLVAPELAAANAALLVCLDSGSVDRLPEAVQPLVGRVPTLNIDHHTTNSRFGVVNWIEPRASSCGEMVWRLLRRARWPLDRAIAEALWVAIVTDTGRFAYELTRPATLRCAADLLRHGVRTSWLNDCLYGQFELRALLLKRRVYDSLEVWADGRAAAVSLVRADFAATGCSKADADDAIEVPRALKGSVLALFFYEAGDDTGVTRLSIRTREPFDATWLAGQFGGGGHVRASGCTVPLPMLEARARVRALAESWLAVAVPS